MIIIAENPSHKPLPDGLTYREKLKYLSGGKVMVGKFGRIRSHDFIDFYLPRLRSMNFFVNSRKFRHPGYKTPDQAFAAGIVMLRQMKQESAKQ